VPKFQNTHWTNSKLKKSFGLRSEKFASKQVNNEDQHVLLIKQFTHHIVYIQYRKQLYLQSGDANKG
jgi:hypothetical protein